MGVDDRTLSLEEAGDPLYLVHKDGFKEGVICTVKGKSQKFKLQSLSISAATFEEIVVVGDGEEISFELCDLKANARIHSKPGGYPVAISIDGAEPFYPSSSTALHREQMRRRLFSELASLAQENDQHNYLFSLHPQEIRTSKAHKKGELIMFPATESLSKVVCVDYKVPSAL
jgi:hypothetical protein